MNNNVCLNWDLNAEPSACHADFLPSITNRATLSESEEF